ncbi:Ig-like domain-containing protein [Pseudomonas oryzae]|uniref:M6 family metalloprotease domain-containing protein n=1 Tax=Pseudomonas oryzae TaxID=1392877 RepID=A0A1H1RUR2_9PSED|nr:Ig-like domain-containing protein [Pseudomonas oryzae]SDS39385.1 M6 family metalloprotease domain-containing protein [Pseudomonas oryzae]
MRVFRPRSVTFLALVALIGSLTPNLLLADTSHTHGSEQRAVTPAARQSASTRTEELVSLVKRLKSADASQRGALRSQLQAKVEQRRSLLEELIQTQPSEVLRVAIPEDKQKGMPPEVIARLEQRLDLEGELEVFYEDYDDGSHKLRHLIKTSFGERFELHFAESRREWRSGLKVRAQGWMLERRGSQSIQGDIALTDDDNGLMLADGGTTTATTLADMPNTKGAQRTLAILVNFQDAPNVKPWTASEANSLIFGSVSDFFKENSSQQTWLTGNVAGWYTIPVSSTSCDGFTIQNYAKSSAQANGFVLSNYDRFLFIFPQNSGCSYSGMGQVGAFPSSAWIHNSMTLRTIGHEMGHNLGLYHAHARDCGNTTLGSSCTSQDYGDTVDIMGYNGTVGHFNGFNKERLGWLASGNIINVASSGSFYIKPNSVATSSAKVLKIPNGTDSSGAASYYYVEYRQPVGFDAKITERGVIDTTNMFNGVTIRQASPSNGNSGYLLDMTAGSDFIDMKDAALTGGRNFTDNGISITTQSTDSSQALVTVDLGASSGSGQTCTRSAPTVSLSPGQSSWLTAGSSYTYTVSVTNKDSSGCASSSFSLAASKPSGWSASLGSASLSLAPGASASTTLKVTSPITATDGFYTIGASATANALTGSGSASFVVDNPTTATNQPPKAVNDSSLLSSVTTVNVPVLSNDSDPEGDKLSIVSFTQGSKGSVSLNSDGTLRYSPAKSFKSGDQFSYTISDGKNSASATVSVSLNVTTTASKGNGR